MTATWLTKTNRLMASKTPSNIAASHPGTLKYVRSFSRLEEAGSTQHQSKRANTFRNASTSPLGTGEDGELACLDAFEMNSVDYEPADVPRASVDLEDLPMEVISITDNFIVSLSAKVNPTPPNIENLSRRFQDFYGQAAECVRTHVRTLAAQKKRSGVSPAPSNSSMISAASLFRAKTVSIGSRDRAKDRAKDAAVPEQQMLTSEELADRKRQRRAMEAKKGHLEEAVERRLCEGIYDKIYRHHSTQDEAQDAKLRSKTAALDVVGIGPLELGVDLGDTSSDAALEKVQDVRARLEGARKELILMTDKRYPLAKLHYLKTCHKEIVDTLAHFHPSSSADEIMPMLIYALITLPPERLNAVSDLKFIQRFRWEAKLVGEAAYCLTNLEAAVTFLETVDISALRSNKSPTGPQNATCCPSSPKIETFSPAYTAPGLTVSTAQSSAKTCPEVTTPANPPPSSGLRAAVQVQNRRLSDLVQTPAQALGVASDTIFTTADQGIKTVSTSLADSYKFLMAKLGAVPNSVGSAAPVPVPQTLDDARKLIGTPPPDGDDDASGSDMVTDDQSLPDNPRTRPGVEDRVLALLSGKKASRDGSVESMRSTDSSSKRLGFFNDNRGKESKYSPHAPTVSNSGLTGSMLSLGSSLNPVAKLGARMNMIRGLGRSTSTPVVPTVAGSSMKEDPSTTKSVADSGDLSTTLPEIAHALPPKDAPKIAPPIQRFLEIQDPGDLKLRETLELLLDYQRLAAALTEMNAFENR